VLVAGEAVRSHRPRHNLCWSGLAPSVASRTTCHVEAARDCVSRVGRGSSGSSPWRGHQRRSMSTASGGSPIARMRCPTFAKTRSRT